MDDNANILNDLLGVTLAWSEYLPQRYSVRTANARRYATVLRYHNLEAGTTKIDADGAGWLWVNIPA